MGLKARSPFVKGALLLMLRSPCSALAVFSREAGFLPKKTVVHCGCTMRLRARVCQWASKACLSACKPRFAALMLRNFVCQKQMQSVSQAVPCQKQMQSVSKAVPCRKQMQSVSKAVPCRKQMQSVSKASPRAESRCSQCPKQSRA